MKRRLVFGLLAALMLVGCLSGCAGTEAGGAGTTTTTGGTTVPTKNEYIQLDYTQVDVGNEDVSAAALEKSFIAQGDLTRLANVIKKAERGEDIVVGAIGGSITEGDLWASDERHKWPFIVAKWFRDTYKGINVKRVNAGIGSTGSVIGNGRANEDLFSEEPDLIVIEFARNDQGAENRLESYEGLVYRALTQPQQPAVILLFMGGQDNSNCQDEQIPIGEKFDLPMISMRDLMVQGQEEGSYTWADMSPDNVHPNDRGYQMTADVIIHRLEMVRQNLDKIDDVVPAVAETTSRFVNVDMSHSENFNPKQLGDFQPQTGMYMNASLSKGWMGTKSANSAPFEFETTSKCVTLVYRTLLNSPGVLNVYVTKQNGEKVKAATINAASTVTWEYANYKTVLLRETDEPVTVTLELLGETGSQFPLLGIIQ